MTNVNEIIWKDVPGFEGFYQVSNTGLVRSIPRIGDRIGETKYYFRELKPSIQRYLRVTLCKDSKLRYFGVHRLVALAFIPNPLTLPMINHKDANKQNNNVSNLEWTNHEGNTRHAVENGLIPKGEKAHNSVLSDAQVVHIRTKLTHLRVYELAKMYCINYYTMWDIVKRRKR